MESEKIIRLGRLAYIHLLDNDSDHEWVTFRDNKGVWDCGRLFWKIYWCSKDALDEFLNK